MWQEQWARVQRSFAEFKKTEDGRTHDRDSDYYRDEMLHFFQDCYHLKDWLRNDPACAGLADDVETAITNSHALSLCGDLANATKHLSLTRSRSGDTTTSLGATHYAVGMGTDQPTTVSVKYEVKSGGSVWDAFNIAEACMDDWTKYLRAKGLI